MSFLYCSHLNLVHENVHCLAHTARSSHHILLRFPRDIGELPLFDYDGLPGIHDPLRKARVGPLDLEHHQVPVDLDFLWVLKTWEKKRCYKTKNRTMQTFHLWLWHWPCGPGSPGSPLPPGLPSIPGNPSSPLGPAIPDTPGKVSNMWMQVQSG